MRLSQPIRATHMKIQVSRTCACTADCAKTMWFFGSSPQASRAATSSRVCAVSARRVVRLGDGVQVDRAPDALMVVLQRDPVADRAEIVAEMRYAGRLDAGKDSLHDTELFPAPAGRGQPLASAFPRRRQHAAQEFAQIEGADELAGAEIGGHADRDQQDSPIQRSGKGRSSATQTVRSAAQSATAITRGGDQHARHPGAELRIEPELAAPRQHDPEQRHVDDGRDAGGERRPDMPERHHQGEVQHEVQHERDEADLHRHGGVAAREEAGRQHLHQHEGGQPEREGGERLRREPRALQRRNAPRTNSTVITGTATIASADRRRQGQEQRVFDRAVHRLAGGLASPERTWRDSSGSSAVPTAVPIVAERQLLHLVGVIEQRDAARRQQAGDDDVHHLVELRHAGAEQPRRHAPHQQAHLRARARGTSSGTPMPARRTAQSSMPSIATPGHADAPGEGMRRASRHRASARA